MISSQSFPLMEQLYIGQQVDTLPSDKPTKLRNQLARREYAAVSKSVTASDPAVLQSIKLVADYHLGRTDSLDMAHQILQADSSPLTSVNIALLFLLHDKVDDAIKALAPYRNDLEWYVADDSVVYCESRYTSKSAGWIWPKMS